MVSGGDSVGSSICYVMAYDIPDDRGRTNLYNYALLKLLQLLTHKSIAISKFLRIEIDIRAFAHTWQHFLICYIKFFHGDNLLLDEEFYINEIAVTSPRYFAQGETIEIKVEGFQ